MQTAFNYDCTPRHVHLCAFNASRYTGKERDSESNLDNFEARYDAPRSGYSFNGWTSGSGDAGKKTPVLARTITSGRPIKMVILLAHI